MDQTRWLKAIEEANKHRDEFLINLAHIRLTNLIEMYIEAHTGRPYSDFNAGDISENFVQLNVIQREIMNYKKGNTKDNEYLF